MLIRKQEYKSALEEM